MELAEKMDTGHNQTKKRRQSSENVSSVLSVKSLTVARVFFVGYVTSVSLHSCRVLAEFI